MNRFSLQTAKHFNAEFTARRNRNQIQATNRWPQKSAKGAKTADSAFEASLGVASLKATTRDAQRRFTEWPKTPPATRAKKDLIHVLGGDFLKFLDALTIARSRRHVARHYKAEMVQLGGFPVRVPPISLYPEIDTAGQFPSYDDVADQVRKYKLWLFRPSEHLRNDLPADVRTVYERATDRVRLKHAT